MTGSLITEPTGSGEWPCVFDVASDEEDFASFEEDEEAEDSEVDVDVDADAEVDVDAEDDDDAKADNAFVNGKPVGELLNEDDSFDDETVAPLFAKPQDVLKSITETAAMANNFHLCRI